MKRLVDILLWSAISAAFIGPGTVTTAASAGAGFGFSLLWALTFSTIACLSLQEASARLTIASGKPLARAMGEIFGKGGPARLIPAAVVAAVVIGCAAYQAGNILGAVAGASLGLKVSPNLLTLATGLVAAALLFAGTAHAVARILGIVVALMGVAFLACAVTLKPSLESIVQGSLVPSLPAGSGMLILGLVGTTVVPYNLFLGSGLARGQRIGDARLGLAAAIPLGGLISMGVLVVGTSVKGEFTFEALASSLEDGLGAWAGTFFAFGLFAAGLSSAVTAPLAAALSVRGCAGEERFSDRSIPYRAVWGGVLLFGLGFGLAQVKPIPAIVLAQALNGIILPLVAVILWIAVNDRELMGASNINGPFANAVMGLSVMVTLLLGIRGLFRAATKVLGIQTPDETVLLATAGALAALLAVPVIRRIRLRRRAGSP